MNEQLDKKYGPDTNKIKKKISKKDEEVLARKLHGKQKLDMIVDPYELDIQP